MIETALGQRSHVNIFGSDYPTPDGSAIRDYIHVTDLATAHVLALEKLRSGSDNLFRGYSVREVIARVEQLSGRRVNARIGPRRAGDPAELVAAAGKAAAILGWDPAYSDLDTIIKTALNWHNTHAQRYRSGVKQNAATPMPFVPVPLLE